LHTHCSTDPLSFGSARRRGGAPSPKRLWRVGDFMPPVEAKRAGSLFVSGVLAAGETRPHDLVAVFRAEVGDQVFSH